jgi:ribosome-associated protein
MICEACDDKKGFDIICLDVRKVSPLTDYLVIASGTSDRHVKAVADGVADALKEIGERPAHMEGREDGNWVLVDSSDVMVHVLKESARDFYALEKLWNRAKRITFE